MFFRLSEMTGTRRENIKDGPGGAMCHYCISPGEKPEGSRFKMVARMELDPGAAVGEHEHSTDEEFYVVLSGKGLFTDDGVRQEIGPGDMMITFQGHSHSIENTGSDPLVFVAVIAE
ncbi:MAG: cupin domain-containing protein [Thermovirgaceae bacterium]